MLGVRVYLKQEGLMKSARRRRAFRRWVKLSALTSLPLIFLLLALKGLSTEHDRREYIAKYGVPVTAKITASRKNLKNCIFRYTFIARSKDYYGGEGGCPLVQHVRAGDVIQVRYDARDPDTSVAPGADTWPRWTFVTILCLAMTFLIYGILVYGIWWEDIRVARRRI